MDLLTIILFVAGMALLVVGAEGLVRGASRLAVTAGISPLVVGLTVVAFGTSSPELAVSISSSFGGDADIAVGNVIGSNIFNVLLILGLASVITPLVVSQQLVRLEVPLMIVVSLALLAFAADGNIGRVESLALAATAVIYTGWAIRKSRRENRAVQEEYAAEFSAKDRTPKQVVFDLALVVGGLGLLILGSEWFVNGATDFAESLGVSDLVIGLTIVAAGTSMPEVATSVLASIRGERDIAVGNVVGSNLFNIMAVLGITGIVSDSGLQVADAALRFDMPFMVAVAIATLPVFFTGRIIARWEGLLFLAYYVAYTLYLLLDASGHDALEPYSVALIGFAAPLTALTLAIFVVRELRQSRRGTAATEG